MPKKGTTKYLSDWQEKEVAKEIGGKQVIASGAIWSMKADVRNDRLLVECKITEKEFYRLTLETWAKIKEQAIKDSLRYPLMCIDVKVKGVFHRYAIFNPKEFGYLVPSFPTYLIAEKITRSILVPDKENEKSVFTNLCDIWLVVIPWKDFMEFAKEKGLI